MKLWKNNFSQKSKNIIIHPNNNLKKLSIKSLESSKYNPININLTSKESNRKSSDSIIKYINNNNNNNKNISFYSSSEEEKSTIKFENIKNNNTKTDNLFRNKNKEFQKLLITTSPAAFNIKSQKNINNNKINNTIIYPKIPMKMNKISKSLSSLKFNKYRNNPFKIKIKKGLSHLQTNNTILNKWRDDFHKLFFKSIKKTKADFSNTFQRCVRNKNKLKIYNGKKIKKKIIINTKLSKENNNLNASNNNEIFINDNNEISSERKKNGIKKGFKIDTSSIPSSPLKTINFKINN